MLSSRPCVLSELEPLSREVGRVRAVSGLLRGEPWAQASFCSAVSLGRRVVTVDAPVSSFIEMNIFYFPGRRDLGDSQMDAGQMGPPSISVEVPGAGDTDGLAVQPAGGPGASPAQGLVPQTTVHGSATAPGTPGRAPGPACTHRRPRYPDGHRILKRVAVPGLCETQSNLHGSSVSCCFFFPVVETH